MRFAEARLLLGRVRLVSRLKTQRRHLTLRRSHINMCTPALGMPPIIWAGAELGGSTVGVHAEDSKHCTLAVAWREQRTILTRQDLLQAGRQWWKGLGLQVQCLDLQATTIFWNKVQERRPAVCRHCVLCTSPCALTPVCLPQQTSCLDL